MASNSPAPEGTELQETPGAGAWGEWNPTEDSARPLRGKHRVLKPRGGLARSSTVLGVGVIAAVGAGGIATAQDRPQVAISVPSLPDLLGGGNHGGAAAAQADSVTVPRQADGQQAAPAQAHGDAGEALRHRILQQAESQQDAAEAQARADAERAARESAAQEARNQKEAADREAEAVRAAAEKAAAEKAAADQAATGQAETKAAADTGSGGGPAVKASGGWSLPTSSYTLTSHYGDSGSMWSSGHHTGLDFAAPTGTPVKAVGGGTVVSAGWSGAYGYRIVLRLQDGTEVWYCHLSSMAVTSGAVGAGDTIGRVGATGNVTGAHLHLEVRKGGSTVDPLTWLTARGLDV
ncbi:murein DD-endopeptidase MepM/ murein hydrolase activator NlpD [Streptomyces sp. Ag109_G2-6]|uniref:M23 family metallopeptidase n=1 Tax=Streptomyces TaxID=1883 RepID=UPI0009A5037D|nr:MULTISPECIES: M23 family metallopeptidase [Streptomyces]RPF41852.1 murein DD-endopeptidase MepM/ murein hydrolase activator NlpD [Streptomyces sp. Ag109_G2-6]